MQVLRFYGASDEHGYLSNFAPYPIRLDGETWPTSEHYFQAQKFVEQKDQREIRKASSPEIAARLRREAGRAHGKRRLLG